MILMAPNFAEITFHDPSNTVPAKFNPEHVEIVNLNQFLEAEYSVIILLVKFVFRNFHKSLDEVNYRVPVEEF